MTRARHEREAPSGVVVVAPAAFGVPFAILAVAADLLHRSANARTGSVLAVGLVVLLVLTAAARPWDHTGLLP